MSTLGCTSFSPEFSKAHVASGTPGPLHAVCWSISPSKERGRVAPQKSLQEGQPGNLRPLPGAGCVLAPKCQGAHPPLLHFTRSGFAVLLLLLIFHRGHTTLVIPFWLLRTLWLGLLTSTCFFSSNGCLLGFSFLEQVTEPQPLGPTSTFAPSSQRLS